MNEIRACGSRVPPGSVAWPHLLRSVLSARGARLGAPADFRNARAPAVSGAASVQDCHLLGTMI